MLRSLKIQVFIVIFILMALLILQAMMSRNNTKSFVANSDRSQSAVTKVNLVGELERDVLDLQRNVLIYKETASSSAVSRFETLMGDIDTNLERLETLSPDEADAERYQDYLSRMRSHLADYEDNFTTVVEGRSRRQAMFEEGLLADINTVLQTLENIQLASNSTPVQSVNLSQISYHISQAQIATLKYVLTPGFEQVSAFQQELEKAKALLPNAVSSQQQKQQIDEQLEKIETDLVQLTQITRGYLFLVNVVMAGSANEFLFLAKELNQLVAQQLSRTNAQVITEVESAQERSDLFAAISVLLGLVGAFFFAYRVMLPIDAITDVFIKLARGKNVSTVPGLTRKDEIGLLANAADVFQDKNQQTRELLNQSQELNAKQESLNKELALEKMRAENATASKSIFLANMSHEIRTPMNGIIGLLDVVLRSDLAQKQRENLNKIAYSTQILMSLINDILDFSKIEAGKLHIEEVLFSPDSLFENILSNINARAQEKNLNIHFYCNPALPTNLVGDPLRISQVLLNLCTNAIKFTRNGSVTIKIDYIRKKSSANKLFLTATIIDTGIGMSANQLSNVFDAFTQADGSTSRKFGGTGLGLSIVKQLTLLMGGEISAESTEGTGSTFNVSFSVEAHKQSNTVFSYPKSDEYKVIYCRDASNAFLYPEYLVATQCKYLEITPEELETYVDELGKEDLLVVDMQDLSHHSEMLSSLNKLKEKQVRWGFITDTQPNNLATLLHKKWDTPALSHPFTPKRFTDFLLDVGNDLVVVQKDGDTVHAEDVKQFDGHVLLVEDNSINQVVASQMLSSMSVTFDVAEDGQQAVTKMINSPHYDLILMDIQMPVLDGYEATQEIRKQGFSDVVICGLSANAMAQDKEKASQAGMDDYLTKPVKLGQLQAMLSKYLPTKELV